jgi:hypothetical protein
MKFIKSFLLPVIFPAFLVACGGPVEGGAVEEDTTPPVFLNGDPKDAVIRACSVTAEFDDPILASSVTNQSFIIYDNSAAAQLTATDGAWGLSSSSDTIAIFEPSIDLVGPYTVTVTTAITNTAGLNLAANAFWTFDASEPCGPVLLSFEPEGTVTEVCMVTAKFDDPILESSINNLSFKIKSNSSPEPLTAADGTWGLSSTSSNTALFVPSIGLVGTYTVTLTTAIANTAGQNLAEDESWTFTATAPCPP